MKNYNVVVAATMLAVAVATPCFGAETPRPTPQDNRIREAVYSEGEVYRVVGVFRSATQILFSAQERIEHVALGDTISWEVAPADNSLFIKPREAAGATNLIVITRSPFGSRTYTFELAVRSGAISARAPDTFFKIAFRYPAQEQAALLAQRANAARAEAAAIQASAIKSSLDLAVLEGKRNLSYSVQGASILQPSEVSDNGQFTALRFPAQRELPAIFAVQPDGSEAIVSYDIRDDFVVVHGVYKQLRLRRGRSVLCVYNDAPDYFGRATNTGTASTSVERTTETGQ
jgi:type IV secretion system protein VirB9